MHYRANAFGINGATTIVPKEAGVKMGQRDGMAPSDILELNAVYG